MERFSKTLVIFLAICCGLFLITLICYYYPIILYILCGIGVFVSFWFVAWMLAEEIFYE